VGYETEAREARVEGYVSGPVSDTVGLRLAGYYSNADGYLDNQVPGTSILDDAGRTPDWSEYAFRATAMFEPTPDFSARFKLNVGRIHDAGANQTTQRVDCPFGAPQSGMPVDCKANSKGVNTGVGPVLGTLDPRFRDGDPYGRQKQWLASLELNYALSEQLKLTSVTGFYHADFSTSVNAENDYYTVLPSVQWFGDKE
jgi:iron complex outermembrane receptor protein